MIVELTYDEISRIVPLYTAAWRDSHKNLCSAEFIEKHDAAYMERTLQRHINNGWRLFALIQDRQALGMVGMCPKTGELGLLYVLPGEQGKGIGTKLLRHGVAQLSPHPAIHLWVLSTNFRAARLYLREGFVPCGERHILSVEKEIYEYKYSLQRNA